MVIRMTVERTDGRTVLTVYSTVPRYCASVLCYHSSRVLMSFNSWREVFPFKKSPGRGSTTVGVHFKKAYRREGFLKKKKA